MFGFLKKREKPDGHTIVSVADGKLINLECVKDAAFAQKMLGDGVAIEPRNGEIVAPCSGRISMLYPTLHAFGVTSEEGMEILVHIGIDTVRLNGRGFTRYVQEGSPVEPGERVISFDSDYLLDDSLDFTVLVLFPGNEKNLKLKRDGYVRKGKDAIAVWENDKEEKHEKQ